ncbi:NAD-dependent epimerase/dehydratase family protein [Candidatus Margulisiibacteriota bacterium]
MKILVTGGAGFIGSHLADKLLADKHNVVVIDNLILGRKENISHNENNPKFKFYKEDILELEQLQEIFKQEKFDVVFHMAANSDIQKGSRDPNVDYELTFMTTFNILQCMKEYKVKQIVFASTSAVYGESKDLLTENYGPLLPVSLYGASKLAAEGFISAFAENDGLQAWLIRFPNVVGERSTHGVIFDFINKLKKDPKKLEVLGNGEQNKPYLYVKDLVEGMLFCWQNAKDKVNLFNLGVESRTKVKEIAALVIKEIGLKAEIVYTGGDRGWVGDVPEFRYDLKKVHKLGWQAKKSSTESIDVAIKKILKKA